MIRTLFNSRIRSWDASCSDDYAMMGGIVEGSGMKDQWKSSRDAYMRYEIYEWFMCISKKNECEHEVIELIWNVLISLYVYVSQLHTCDSSKINIFDIIKALMILK